MDRVTNRKVKKSSSVLEESFEELLGELKHDSSKYRKIYICIFETVNFILWKIGFRFNFANGIFRINIYRNILASVAFFY